MDEAAELVPTTKDDPRMTDGMLLPLAGSEAIIIFRVNELVCKNKKKKKKRKKWP
jgi:hypothetical protein